MILSRFLAIDMGSAYTKVIADDKGVVYNEPTLVAVCKEKDIVATGNDVMNYLRCANTGICIKKPIKNGVIADWEMARKYLSSVVKKICFKEKRQFIRAVITVPANITEMERETFEDAAKASGIGELYLLHSSVAGAIGGGADISAPLGQMVLDVGVGKSECSVVAMGGIVSQSFCRTGGDSFTNKISNIVRNKWGVILGTAAAEEAKKTVFINDESEIKGRCIKTGLPARVTVSQKEVTEACESCFTDITDMIKNAMSNTPPELMGDIISNGILLTGGGSRLEEIGNRIEESLGIRTIREENRDILCVLGAHKAADQLFAGRRLSFAQRLAQ